jgi:hypothetical protein
MDFIELMNELTPDTLAQLKVIFGGEAEPAAESGGGEQAG